MHRFRKAKIKKLHCHSFLREEHKNNSRVFLLWLSIYINKKYTNSLKSILLFIYFITLFKSILRRPIFYNQTKFPRPESINSLLVDILVCYVATRIYRKPCKTSFYHPNFDFDPEYSTSYSTDFTGFLYVYK